MRAKLTTQPPPYQASSQLETPHLVHQGNLGLTSRLLPKRGLACPSYLFPPLETPPQRCEEKVPRLGYSASLPFLLLFPRASRGLVGALGFHQHLAF